MTPRKRPLRDNRLRARKAPPTASALTGSDWDSRGRTWLASRSLEVPEEISDPVVLRGWWESRGKLRLLAALIIAAHLPLDPQVPINELSTYLFGVLRKGQSPRQRELAAVGLLHLFLHSDLFDDASSAAQLRQALDHAFLDPQTWRAMLAARLSFEGSPRPPGASKRLTGRFPPDGRLLYRVSQDPRVASADAVRVVLWDAPRWSREADELILRLLRDPETPVDAFTSLLAHLSSDAAGQVFAYAADASVPFERRLRALTGFEKPPRLSEDRLPTAASALLKSYSANPELCAAMVHFSRRSALWAATPDALELSRQPDLSGDLRQAIGAYLVAKWQGGRPRSDELAALLAVARYPGVLNGVYPDIARDKEHLPQTPETEELVLAFLRDASSPVTPADRQTLALLIRSWDLAEEDQLLLAQLLAESPTSRPQDTELARSRLVDLTLASDVIARSLLRVSDLPATTRAIALDILPCQDRIRFMANLPITDPDYEELFTRSLYDFFPTALGSELLGAARDNTEVWQKIVGNSAFFGNRAEDLYPVLADRSLPPAVRGAALSWADCLSKAGDSTFPEAVRQGVLADPEAPFALLAQALRLCGTTDLNALSAEDFQRLTRAIPDKPDLGVGILAENDQSFLRDLVTDPRLDQSHRHALTRALRSQGEFLRWEVWREAILGGDDPYLAVTLLQTFEQQEKLPDVGDLYRVVAHENLPRDLRARALRLLWKADAWMLREAESPSDGVSIAEGLIAFGDDPDLVAAAFPPDEAFHYGAWFYPPKPVQRTIDQVHNPRLPLLYRRFLAHQLIPTEADMAPEERRRVIELLREMVESVPERERSQVWRLIKEHSRQLADARDRFIADPAAPDELRIEILRSYYSPRGLLQRFLTIPEASQERVLAEFQIPRILTEELRRARRTNDPAWHATLACPAFLQASDAELFAQSQNPALPYLARWLASELLLQSQDESSAHAEVIRQAIVAIGDPRVDTLSRRTTETILGRIPDQLRKTAIEFLVCELRDPSHASFDRAGLVGVINPYVVRSGAKEIWEAIRDLNDPRLEARFLSQLAQNFPRSNSENLLPILEEARQPDGERGRAILRELDDFMRHPLSEPARVVRFLASPLSLCRAEALHALARFSHRQIWEYATGADARPAWENDVARAALATALKRSVRTPGLGDLIEKGPDDPRWPALAALARHPDQSLAQQAIEVLGCPTSPSEWVAWLQTSAPDVPPAAVLAAWSLGAESDGPGIIYRQINQAFRAARSSHSATADLTDALLRAAATPPTMQARLRRILENVAASDRDASSGKDLGDLITYARLEAALVARLDEIDDVEANFDRDVDLRDLEDPRFAAIPPGSTLSAATRSLEESVLAHVTRILPGVTVAQAGIVLQKTVAPVVLAAQYQRVYSEGLPLLAQAVQIASLGEAAWQAWRFEREAAIGQLRFLSEAERRDWSRNRAISVEVTAIPEGIAAVAETVRRRFQQALRAGEIPVEYQELVAAAGRPAQAIADYRALHNILGKRLGQADQVSRVPEDLTRRLPARLVRDVEPLLQSTDRHALLRTQQRLARAISLIRLLHCDANALARNQILAEGESGADARSEGAVKFCEKLRRDLPNDGLRESRQAGNQQGAGRPASLDSAFADARAALESIRAFAPRTSYVVEEVSDFPRLIEIGRCPYGQGSCQNYASVSSLNRALLAYVVDAMTKALVVRTPATAENPDGTPLARAILKLGQATDGMPLLVLERSYAAGGEAKTYDPILEQAARALAQERGWRLGKIIERDEVVPEELRTTVRIAASQNHYQYEDGLQKSIANADQSDYTMEVRTLA